MERIEPCSLFARMLTGAQAPLDATCCSVRNFLQLQVARARTENGNG